MSIGNQNVKKGNLLDFNSKRLDNIEKKRRAVERIIFENFLGTYSVVDNDGTIYPVQVVDISRNGCLMQVPDKPGVSKKFALGTEHTLRLYFTKGSYIPAIVFVKYETKHYESKDGQKYLRLGCEFDVTVPSYTAMEAFIEFLYKFAEHSAIDKGDSKVYFL